MLNLRFVSYFHWIALIHSYKHKTSTGNNFLNFSVGSTGPLFDEEGQVLTHTILGSWEDFQNEAIKRGDIEVRIPSNPWQLF